MDEATFDKLARQELREIEDALASVDPDDIDVGISDGVLRLDLRDKTRVVINSHRAAKQIWMAAVSTAWHFDLTPSGHWVAAKTGEELRATLQRLIEQRIGIQVTVRPMASILSVIQLRASVAWADGKLSTSEGDALRRLFHRANLTNEERTAAYAMLERPVAPPTAFAGIPSSQTAEGVYRAACKLAFVDNQVDPNERGMLARLQKSLHLDDDLVATIQREVFGKT